MFWTILSVASSAMQAISAYQQGMAAKAAMDAQADVQRLQYKTKVVEAKEQGVKVLKETNRALSTAIAQAGASGILTNEGSALLNQTMSIRSGVEDFQVSKLNEEILQNLGLMEVRNSKEAGKIKAQQGIMGALTGFGTGLTNAYQGGLFGPTTTTSSTLNISSNDNLGNPKNATTSLF